MPRAPNGITAQPMRTMVFQVFRLSLGKLRLQVRFVWANSNHKRREGATMGHGGALVGLEPASRLREATGA